MEPPVGAGSPHPPMDNVHNNGRNPPRLIQDMPPRDGYKPIHYKRYLPNRGVSGIAMFLLAGAIYFGGLTITAQTLLETRERKAERDIARRNILPILQAESDRAFVRAQFRWRAEEQDIMSDKQPGYQVPISHLKTRQWVEPRRL